MWSTGEYTEVLPHKRLVYTDSPSDENGNVVSHGSHSTMTEVTVILEDLGGRTKMVMMHAGLPENRQGANEGWKQSFAKMADHIKTVLDDK